MITAGRKKKPLRLELLQGNPTKRPVNRLEPKATTGVLVDPPEWLTDSQKEEWAYAIQHAPPGMLMKADNALMVAWVVAYDTYRIACNGLAKHSCGAFPLLSGGEKPSPYLVIKNREVVILAKLAGELGFCPTARSRIMVDAEQDNADTADLFRL